MPDNECNCDITPGYDSTLENRLIKGQELIYYTSKIKQAIAAAVASSEAESASSLQELLELLGDLETALESHDNNLTQYAEEIQGTLSDLEDLISSKKTELTRDIMANENNVLAGISSARQAILDALSGFDLDHDFELISSQLAESTQSIENKIDAASANSLTSIQDLVGSAKQDVIDAMGNLDIDPSAINDHTTAEADRILEGIEDVVIAGGDQLNQHMDAVEDAIIAEIQRQATDPETDDTLLSKIKEMYHLLATPKNMCLDCTNTREYIINSANDEQYEIMPVVEVSEEKFNELIQGLYSYNICNLTVYVTGSRASSNGNRLVTCHPIVGAYSYTTRSIDPVDDEVMETIPDEIKYNYDSLPCNMDGILMMFTQSLTPYDETLFITPRQK